MKTGIKLIFSIVFACNNFAFAQDSNNLKKINLTPSVESTLELLGVSAQINDDGTVKYSVKDTLNIHKPSWGYTLDVDLKNESYTAKELSPEDLDKINVKKKYKEWKIYFGTNV